MYISSFELVRLRDLAIYELVPGARWTNEWSGLRSSANGSDQYSATETKIVALEDSAASDCLLLPIAMA